MLRLWGGMGQEGGWDGGRTNGGENWCGIEGINDRGIIEESVRGIKKFRKNLEEV